jgi:hypothetical protein
MSRFRALPRVTLSETMSNLLAGVGKFLGASSSESNMLEHKLSSGENFRYALPRV